MPGAGTKVVTYQAQTKYRATGNNRTMIGAGYATGDNSEWMALALTVL
ncbi:MAG TPA: hypothetical protein VGK73_30145 [Polyangiaceae bacterium]